MLQSYDFIVSGGTVVTHAGAVGCDIGIKGERIATLGDLSAAHADKRFDATGLHILPGVIDTHVSFREPGADYKEDLESGSRAAVMGGVTSVFEQPAIRPATTSAEGVKDKLSRARARMWCDFAFYVGATPDNARALTWLERMPGVCGVSVNMDASLGADAILDDDALYDVLRHGNRRVAIHAADEARLNASSGLRRAGDVSSHLDWYDDECTMWGTERALKQARRTGRRVHFLHVSSAEEMRLLSENKDIASLELTPQHLSLVAPDCYKQMGSRALMSPPIRSERHLQALWRGLDMGSADCIGSAHAPHTIEEKARPYPDCPPGMPGVQTLVPVMLTHVNAGRLSLERFVDLTSLSAHRLFGLRDKGLLAPGYHADLTLVDLKKDWEISDSAIASRVSWTPFHGFSAKGLPRATMVRGQFVVVDGAIAPAANGQPIRFQDSIRGELVDFD